MKKVDLIILSHNAWKSSNSFLEWLFDLSDFDDFRLIWIDNGSTDEHVEKLPEFFKNKPDHILHVSDTNLGAIGGRLLGYEISQNDSAPYVMFLDNDQFVRPGWFENHFAYMKHYDLVGIEAWQFDEKFLPIKRCIHPKQPFDYIGVGGMLMKRIVPETIGLFDDAFNPAYFEDPDFTYRAIEAGFQVGWNPRAKVIHIAHQTLGLTNWTEQFDISHKVFYKKWKGRNPDRVRMKHISI